jgi:hypothetical protein
VKRHPELRKLRKQLKEAGCDVIPARGGSHLKIYNSRGKQIGSFSGNKTDGWRTLKNLRSDLERMGIKL